MSSPKSKPQPVPAPTRTDSLNINARLYRQVGEMLTQLEEGEHITLKERIAALIAIGRIQVIFMGLRKEKVEDNVVAGSKVRKYAAGFKAHDASRRKTASGHSIEPDDDDNTLSVILGGSDDEPDDE